MALDHVRPLLLLEDNPDDVSFVRRALVRGHVINPLITCGTAADARRALQNAAPADMPALALVDIRLPGESGLEFVAWLRKEALPLTVMPVLLFTNSQDPAHEAMATRLGAATYLRKPVTEASLVTAIHQLGLAVTTTVRGPTTTRLIERREQPI
jgi:CheY-like chemotaxis protein